MKLGILSALAIAMTVAPALAASALQPLPIGPGLPALVPVPYDFGVVIKEDTFNTLPVIQGSLMAGCTFHPSLNYGVVRCVPPTAPAPGTYWVCSFSGLIATATSGTVVGHTLCNNEPMVTAIASSPGTSWNLQRDPLYLLNPIYSFPWYCIADFHARATGNVLCDEPDPPVDTWDVSASIDL